MAVYRSDFDKSPCLNVITQQQRVGQRDPMTLFRGR